MKLLKLYEWIIGTMSDFAKQFQDNKTLYNQARKFWSNLEASSIIIVGIFIVLGIIMAYTYYKPFNDKPGRHYKPKYWGIFLGITSILSFLVTLGSVYFMVPPNVDGSFVLVLKIALDNAIHSSIVYALISWIWCQFNLPTNAYRYLKF
jgi:hypothetical protein